MQANRCFSVFSSSKDGRRIESYSMQHYLIINVRHYHHHHHHHRRRRRRISANNLLSTNFDYVKFL